MTDLREEIAKIVESYIYRSNWNMLDLSDSILSLPSGMVITKDGISRDLTLGEAVEYCKYLVNSLNSAGNTCWSQDGEARIEMKEG